MRHLVIIGTIAVSLGLVAGAQASDWFRPRQQSSQQVDRHAERHDRGRHSERHDSRDHKWRADCTAQPGARLSADDVRGKLTSAGYQVWSLEPKRDGCIEAKVVQADGQPNKLYLDPTTAEIKYRKR
jgi:hypothetical protein